MVKTVLSIRCSVFRKSVEISESLIISIIILKHIALLFFFLNTECWILSTAHARELGVHGKIAVIEEHDPIVLIQSKLRTMEENGELKRHNLDLQKKTRAAIERPKPVEGIFKATETRVFYYDPTYIVQEDIKDHQDQTIHSKGTRINPLETVSLSQGLLFFDGDDADQVAFAKEKLKNASLKLILTKGAPLALSEELKIPVYFDQSGLLTKKLGIHHVPALVTQDFSLDQAGGGLSGDRSEGSLRLRIEEIKREDQK